MKKIKSPIDINIVKEKVTKCVPVRKYINNILFKERNSFYRNIVRFCSTNKEARGNLRTEINEYIVRPLYYTGGWPKEDSKGIIEDLAFDLGRIVYYLKFFGFDDELKNELSKVGVKDVIIDESLYDGQFKINNPTAEVNKNQIAKEIYNLLNIQKEICYHADLIKVDAYKELPQHIKKSKDNPTGIDDETFSDIVKKQLIENKEKCRERINEKTTINKNFIDTQEVYYNNLIKDDK